MLTDEQKHNLKSSAHSLQNGLIDTRLRWPGNTLIYDIGKEMRDAETLIKSAMSQISSGTCIKFKKRTNEQNYVRFQVNAFILCFVNLL